MSSAANAVGRPRSQIGVKADPGGSQWSGACEWFCKWSYGGSYPSGSSYGSAIDHYCDLKNQGRILTTGTPPGALVFWNTSSWGHVGVSVGAGQVASTMGQSDWAPVAKVAVSSFANYEGYSLQP